MTGDRRWTEQDNFALCLLLTGSLSLVSWGAYPPDPPLQGYKERIEVGDVFCVRRRDGRSYAKIKINTVEKHRIAFDWVYQKYPFLGFY
jgi:hypothetical protein